MGENKHLQRLAREARILTLRSIHAAGSGHPGGCLSAADLLTWLYYLRYTEQSDSPCRIVLSKGHACPVQYALLSLFGQIPASDLCQLRRLGSPLQGHPHCACLPQVETSTGSLGQGFGVALGMAMGLRHQGDTSSVYAILGDGELQEGSVWEAAMCAAHHRLNRLWAVVDCNGLQSDAPVSETLAIEPLRDKWESFGWHVIEIDGHDFRQMEILKTPHATSPTAVLARTVKGKGIPFMEHTPLWHGSLKLSDDDLSRALLALNVPASTIETYLFKREE